MQKLEIVPSNLTVPAFAHSHIYKFIAIQTENVKQSLPSSSLPINTIYINVYLSRDYLLVLTHLSLILREKKKENSKRVISVRVR